jgi:hypothetical protein
MFGEANIAMGREVIHAPPISFVILYGEYTGVRVNDFVARG